MISLWRSTCTYFTIAALTLLFNVGYKKADAEKIWKPEENIKEDNVHPVNSSYSEIIDKLTSCSFNDASNDISNLFNNYDEKTINEEFGEYHSLRFYRLKTWQVLLDGYILNKKDDERKKSEITLRKLNQLIGEMRVRYKLPKEEENLYLSLLIGRRMCPFPREIFTNLDNQLDITESKETEQGFLNIQIHGKEYDKTGGLINFATYEMSLEFRKVKELLGN